MSRVDEHYLRVRDYAERFSLSESAVYKKIERGEIRAIRNGHLGLLEHRMRANPAMQPLVFSRCALAGRRRGPDGPFSDSGINQRARKRWQAKACGRSACTVVGTRTQA